MGEKNFTRQDFLKYLFFRLCYLEVEGRENFPSRGAFIVAANHLSVLDVPLAAIVVPRPVVFIVKRKWQWILPAALYLKLFHKVIYFGKSDQESYQKSVEVLRQGGVIGIAPEGTRSKLKALQKAHRGVARLAFDALVPVVPMAMYGQEEAWYKWMRFQRPRIVVRVGEPIEVDVCDDIESFTTKVMCGIANMLPKRYRGVYQWCSTRKRIQ